MSFLTQQQGWAIFGAYAIGMILLTWLFTKPDQTKDEHLVANRKVSILAGAFSIAVTWIWAPAIFIASQKSYEQGLPGIFWFTVPNIICFFIFAPLGMRMRKMIPEGYSMPDFMWQRFGGDRRVHVIFVVASLGYQLGAIIINTLAGGLLMHALTGLPVMAGIFVLAGIALLYSIWRGLPASIITDVVQMLMILLIACLLLPWSMMKAGGIGAIVGGLGGRTGAFTNIFDPWIAYSFGIPVTLSLIAGPIVDQMFYQRAMAAQKEKILPTFVLGGLVFGIIPVVLSLFGFIAANPAIQPLLNITDTQMVGVQVVQHFLPMWTLFGFALMAIAGLSSTLDSAYCAIGSLFAVDLYHRYINRRASEKSIIRASQFGMLVLAALGTAIALIPNMKLLWVFLIYGALASAGFVPVIASLYSRHLTGKGVFWSILLSLIVSLPLSTYANITESSHLVVLASLSSVLIGSGVCLLDLLCRRPFLTGIRQIRAIETR